jgi:hypothetical protein
MSLLTMVNEACLTVGVHTTTTVFGNINADRTMLEMVEVANEMAAQIAADMRDWTKLRKVTNPLFVGDGIREAFLLPTDYRRMLATSEVWLSSNTMQPARFIPDTDEWIQRRVANESSSWGEWTIFGGEMHIWPPMGPGVTARFAYLDKNHIELRDTVGALVGLGEKFASDADTYRLDERLLKLGMVWRWKQLKGSPYAEDLGSWSNSMATAMGSDSPAPILIGRSPISANTRYAYPWNAPT